MWILLPLAFLLAVFALWAGLTSGPAPRLATARVLPVIRSVLGITLIGFFFGCVIGFASAKRTQERAAHAILRDARQRLAEKPAEPEVWKAKIAAAERDVQVLDRTPPPFDEVLSPLIRTTSLAFVLSALGAGVVLFRKRLDP